MIRRPRRSTLLPYTTLFRSNPQQASRAMAELWINDRARALDVACWLGGWTGRIESLDWRQVPRANSPERSVEIGAQWRRDRESTRLNSSNSQIPYDVFCLPQ